MKSLEFRISRTQDLDEDTKKEIVEVCTAAFQKDFGSLFTKYLSPECLHVMGYLEGQLITHAVVSTRWAQPANQPVLKTAYIDAVATLPVFQNHGCGSALMTRLAAEITDYEIACLETERIAFYQRVGWKEWQGPLAGRSENGLVLTPEQRGIMVLVLPKTPELDFNTLLTIECQSERIW